MEAEKIRELSLACQTEVLALRKYFHCAPELSAREQSTMAAIAAQLQKSGIPFTVIPDGGILAQLDWADANAPDAPHVCCGRTATRCPYRSLKPMEHF